MHKYLANFINLMSKFIFIGCEYINELSLPCKNPIFLSWLNEFYEDAKKKRFKSAHTIKKAIKSLQSYDQELKTGYECKVLPYFGEGLCSKIDEKIAVFNQKSNFSPQDNDAISTKQSDDNSQSQLSKKTENNEDSFEDGKKDETKPIQFNIKASNLSYHSKHILMNYKKYDYNTLPLKNIRNCFKNTFGTYKFHNLAEKDDNFIASIKQLTQNHLICKTTKNEYSITNIGKSMINQPEFVLEETNKILKCISNNQEKLLDINLNHEISLEKSQEKKIINNFDSKSNDSNKLNQHCENFNGIDDIDLNENRYFDHDQHYGDNFEYNLNSEVYQYSSDEKSIEQNLIGRSNSEVEFIEESSLNSLQSQCQKSIERYQNIENADINERILSIKGNNNDSIIAISDTTNVEKESIVNSIHSPDVCDKNIFRMANKNSNTLKYQFCAEDGTHVEDSTSAFKCSTSIGKSILVEVDYMELLMSGFLYLIKESSNINSNLVQVYLRLNDIKDHFTNTKLDHSKTSTPSILLSSKKTPLSLKRSFSEFDYFKADVGDNRIAKNLSVDFNNDSHGKNSSSIMLNDQTIAEIKAQISLEIDPNFSLYSVCPAEKLQKPQHENEFYSKLIHEGFHPSVIEANTFEIILIVDNSEPEYSANSLKQMGIKAERQKLNVGDFIWVARTNDSEHSKKDIALDFIVERKRCDDLAASIMDGRFAEQKSRLKKTNIRHIFYLHEKAFGPANRFKSSFKNSLMPEIINQALTNTIVCDGFFLKQTKDIDATVSFLKSMTERLIETYSKKTIYCFEYNEFISLNNIFGKLPSIDSPFVCLVDHRSMDLCLNKNYNPSIKELFAKSLTKIGGVGWIKAIEIIKIYPTPRSLINAYRSCNSEQEKSDLLSNITYGGFKRKIGSQTSNAIYKFFMH